MRQFLTVLAVLAAVALGGFQPSAAQQPAPDARIALFADTIRYETRSRELVADGNVQVYYGDFRLTARAIRYDGVAETIRAEGPMTLEGPDGAVLLASMAELSADLREGLIEGARLIFDRQFQIAAAEGRRTQGRFNALRRTVASSCSLCEGGDTPIWRIRARSVVHDEERRRLYFEDAWFDIFGLPLVYIPRLRVPEPGVERAEGLLVPTLRTSGVFGIGAKFPYYIPLGDHADITLTPFIATEGAALLEAEYRQRFRSGQIRLEGVYALRDGLGENGSRGLIGAEGRFDLPRGYRLDFDLRYTSDRSFLGQFGYGDEDRLTSYAAVSREGDTSFIEVRAESYQTLRETERQGEVPFVFPLATYRKLHHGVLGGTLGIETQALGIARSDGRDVARLSADVDWRGSRILAGGVVATGIAELATDVYAVSDDAAYDDGPRLRSTPTLGVELRWPLLRAGAAATHVIEPVAQLFYGETIGADDVPNEDGLLPEFDENNLFALNRFPGRDRRETGLRLNAGVSYTRFDPAGWNMGATLGRVFRPDEATEFSASTGLREAYSDYVAAVSLELPPRFNGVARALFNDNFDFKRADMELDYRSDRLDLSGIYTFLASDATDAELGVLAQRQELSLATRYRFHPNWEIAGEWRYDIAASRSIEALGALTFGNECIEAELGLSRRFTAANEVPSDTRVSLEVRLAGIGAGASQGWPARQCRGK